MKHLHNQFNLYNQFNHIFLKKFSKTKKMHKNKNQLFIYFTIFITILIFSFTMVSCISIETKETTTIQNKGNTTLEKKENASEILSEKPVIPFIKNPVKDEYNYPYVPSDFLNYTLYSKILKNISEQKVENYKKNNNEIYNYIIFYNLIKEYYLNPDSIFKYNNNKFKKIIYLTELLEKFSKNKNQFFKAKYYYQLNKAFSNLKTYLEQYKYQNNQIKSQNLTAIANMFYLAGEKLLIPSALKLSDKALSYRKYDIAYFINGKLNIMLNQMQKACLSFGLGLKYLTSSSNQSLMMTYYYQTRETVFNYIYTINFNNTSTINDIILKTFIPNNTEYQNISSFQIFLDNKSFTNYRIIKNPINQNILYINISSLKAGKHIIKISMNIHTIPYKFDSEKLLKYTLNDYSYTQSVIKATLKPSIYFDFNNEKIKNYAKSIKESLPSSMQQNVIALIKQAYLFVINKLTYDLHIMNDPGYRYTLDKKYGKDAVRALIKPKNSVCENYATLLTTILKALKIPAFYSYGPVYKLPYHAWVKVLMPDNNYYILDPTFGDPINQNGTDSPLYFLFNPANRIEEGILDPNYPIIENNPDSNITITYKGSPINNFSYSTNLIIINKKEY